MNERRLGVYICYCGGNISDYVDCERARDAIADEPDVVVARTTMFACSDAAQQEIAADITEQSLDGIVVASCSPTLHLQTFRAVAERAGLNPYQYVQVNLREQCSWAHTNLPDAATEKAISMLRAGIARARYTQPYEKTRIETVPRALVVGGGVAGLRAALALSDLGIAAFVIEREEHVGGWVGGFGKMYPADRDGRGLIGELVDEIGRRDDITIYTGADLIEKTGTMGDFEATLAVAGGDRITLNVGAIIVATGFDVYQPESDEYGFGHSRVVTLPDFKRILDSGTGPVEYLGTPVRTVAYVYCVGGRCEGGGHEYCSRYCCNAAIHASLLAHERSPSMQQFHLYRDIRTYGKFESLFTRSRQRGSVFIKFDPHDPPRIETDNGTCRVSVTDVLTEGRELQFGTDLVVLVTAMEPRVDPDLINVLKLPVGLDGFFKEIHPKLRPVETVIDGVFIAGAAQAPRTSAESVASALAATAKSAALLKRGYVELEPLVATVNADACTWCDVCSDACPYDAISRTVYGEKAVAIVSEATCKGCGACVPVCPEGAIDLRGSTDQQIRAMIEAMGVAHA
jgi:heterodisulfide reductase subunit A